MRFIIAFAGFLAATILAGAQGVAPKLLPIDGGTGSWAWVNVLNTNCVGSICASAKGDGTTDDWEAIQLAIGLSASSVCTHTQPTLVVIPPTTANTYRVSQAIRACPNVMIWVQSNSTTIKATGDAIGPPDYTGAINLDHWPTFGLLMVGTVQADSTLPTLAVSGSLALGAMSVTLTTPAQAAQIVVGDVIDIETTQTWSPAGTEPTSVIGAVVTSTNASTGVIGFDRPVDFASSSVQVRRLTNGANTGGWPTLQNTNIPQYASHDFHILGGRWVGASATPQFQPFESPGGCISCSFKPDFVSAGATAGASNFYQDTVIEVRESATYQQALELAYHMSHTNITLGTVRIYGWPTSRAPLGWDIGFDEGSHDNTVSVGQLQDYTREIGVVALTGTPTVLGGDAINASVAIPGGATYSGSFTSSAGATLSTMATGLAASLTAASGFTSAGFTATANPQNGVGKILIVNSDATVAFLVTAGYTGAVTAFAPGHGIVNVVDSFRNDVKISSVTGGIMTGPVVNLTGGTATGEPPTSDNKVSIEETNLSAFYAGVVMSKPGVNNNIVRGSEMHGALLQPDQFWFQYGLGSYNTIADFQSDSPGGFVECDQSLAAQTVVDTTNTVRNIQTDVAPNNSALASSALVAKKYCTITNTYSIKGKQFSSLSYEWLNVNGSIPFISYNPGPLISNALEVGDVVRMTGVFTATPSADVKTGNFQAFLATCTFSVPADATYGTITADYTGYAVNSFRGRIVITSDSPTTPTKVGDCLSFSLWSGSAATSWQIDRLTSGTLNFSRVNLTPYVGYTNAIP